MRELTDASLRIVNKLDKWRWVGRGRCFNEKEEDVFFFLYAKGLGWGTCGLVGQTVWRLMLFTYYLNSLPFTYTKYLKMWHFRFFMTYKPRDKWQKSYLFNATSMCKTVFHPCTRLSFHLYSYLLSACWLPKQKNAVSSV